MIPSQCDIVIQVKESTFQKRGNMEPLKIGFVPAHREPFDEDWASKMRRRCLDAFPLPPLAEIIVPDEKLTKLGCVRDDGEAEKVIALFREQNINGLIIGTMTFGDEVSALAVAAAFRHKPVLLFGTREGAFTADGNRRSDSFCGTLSISSGLHRRQIPFLFGGIVFPEEKEFKESVTDFLRVCAVSRGFVGAKIGLVGPRPERFETCIFSEDLLMRKFRQRVIPVDLADIMSRASALKDSVPVKKLVKNIKAEAESSAIKADILQNIAGLEYALEDFAAEKGLAALGVQCWTAMQSVYGLSPCHAMGRLTDKGIMTSCEVDIYGALTMLLQYLASLGETVPHFIDWTIRHQEKENAFLAWHCGNAPPSLACRDGDISLKYHSILGPSLGIDRSLGTGEFQLAPGAVTLSRLQEHDGKFKLLVAGGKIFSSRQQLRGCWSWVEVPDLDKLYATLVKEGFTHHASLIHGDCSRALVDACGLLGIEAVVVR
jgi:L-fucose isomerase-like protein